MSLPRFASALVWAALCGGGTNSRRLAFGVRLKTFIGDEAGEGIDSMIFDDDACSNGVHLVADIEGDYNFLLNWLHGLKQKGAVQNITTRPITKLVWRQLARGQDRKLDDWLPREGFTYIDVTVNAHHCLITTGDTLDAGNQKEREHGVFRSLATLLMLQDKYPDQVKLIAGNRDVNKLRLSSELDEYHTFNGQPGPFVYHTSPGPVSNSQSPLDSAGKSCAGCRPQDSDAEMQGKDALKTKWFKWVLNNNMGAKAAFKGYKEEIAKLRGVESNGVSDDDVTEYVFHQTVTPGGLFFEYLRRAGLIAYAKGALFMHGNVQPCMHDSNGNFLFPSGDEGMKVRLDMKMIASQRAKSAIDKFTNFAADAATYVSGMHRWKMEAFEDWMENPTYFSTEDGCGTRFLCRGGNGLIDMALSAPSETKTRNGGFSQCSPVTAAASEPHGTDFATFLLRKNVRFIFTGHKPMGATPRIFTTEIAELPDAPSLSIVNSDLTFGHPYPSCHSGRHPSQHCIKAVSAITTYNLADSGSVEIDGQIVAEIDRSRGKVLAYRYPTSAVPNISSKVEAWAGPGKKYGVPKKYPDGSVWGGYEVLMLTEKKVRGGFKHFRLWEASSELQNEPHQQLWQSESFKLRLYTAEMSPSSSESTSQSERRRRRG